MELVSNKIRTRGLTTTLKSGAKVRVGFDEDRKTDGYFFTFTNKDGEETRIKLSQEAYDAVIQARPKIDMLRDVGECAEWREVKTDQEVEPKAQ